jgi:multiple sugar transport system ATP-binding protein
MAMVFQTFALYPHLTVFDNLAYPLREAGAAKADIQRRVGEIAEMLRLTHTLKRKPETASGGEQQRIAIGRALIRRPKLLLLDEPITNLDAKLRHDTRAEFKRLHRDLGMTMLYATPDELEALSMGQRIAVLKAGRVVQTGTPDELYDAPDNAYVGAMVGSPKMNLLRATSRAGAVQLSFAELSAGPWSRALAAFPNGTDLLFGFRPHDLEPVNGAPQGSAARGPAFRARVHLIEPLGDITILDMQAADSVFRMVLPEEQAVQYRVGDEFDVALNLGNSHVFAADTGTAIR